MKWRHFKRGAYREALAHIYAGGIAIHDTGMKRNGKETAHLLADGTLLFKAAADLGLSEKYLQMTPRPHFDLFGWPLTHALARCELMSE